MLNLVLVRHGDAVRGSGDGSTPAPDYGLSPVGREQVRATARYLAATGHLERCRTLISSPAPRARETADVLAAAYSGERAMDASFSEINELPDGTREDLPAALQRARAALELLAREHDGCTLVIVTHSGFIMASVRALFAIPTPGTGARSNRPVPRAPNGAMMTGRGCSRATISRPRRAGWGVRQHRSIDVAGLWPFAAPGRMYRHQCAEAYRMTKKQSTARARKSAKTRATNSNASSGFTKEEREAMRDRVKELKTARNPSTLDGERAVLEKIATMAASDRDMGERLHAIVKASAPGLTPRLWYGMPAYAKNGNVVCFFQSAAKFKSRYCTLGFSDKAALDDGHMWPTSYALTELGTADEATIAALLKRAIR